MSRRPAQPFLLFLFGGLLLATALPTDAATLTLSQQPLFLTEGVAPNIMVTIDNSNSMRWSFAPDGMNPTTGATYNGYSADQVRTSRRAKSSTFNPLYYNPNVTYQAPYNVLYSNAVTTYTPLTTSFTAAYVNGFKSAKGSLDLSSAYKVSWEYDTARATTDSTYWTYTGYTSYSSPDKVYYLAANPSSDFSSSSTTSSTSSSTSVSGSTTSTGKSASLTGGGTYTVTAKSNSCTATITNPKSTTGSTTTNSDGSTSSTTTAVSYSSANCSYTTSGKTTTYTVTSTATTTLTTTTTYPDRTKAAVPAYYYVYNTALSGCSSNVNDDNCYKLVTVSSTSGSNGSDERQNFANWYSFYRNRELATQSGANLAFVSLPENTRLSWQALGTSDTCITSSSYLSSYNCRGLSNTSTSYYDNRLGTFSGAHRAKFFEWLGDIYFNQGTPLLDAVDRVGSLLSVTGKYSPYAYAIGSSETPLYSCRASYSITLTDGIWNTAGSHGDWDSTSRTLPDGQTYSARAPYKDSASNTLADLAFKYWATDAQPNIANNVSTYIAESNSNATTQYWNPKNDPATWQHMVSYFVGLGLTTSLTNPAWGGDTYSGDYSKLAAGTLSWPAASSGSANNVYDLWHAAIDSRGEFFSVDSPDDLVSALQNVVNRISQREDSGAAPALVSSPLLNADSSTADSELYSYTPKFASTDWSGDLIKYLQNTANGSQTSVWSAQNLMDSTYGSGNSAWSTRTVKMAGSTAGTLKDFTWSNLSSAQQTTLNKTLASVTDSNGEKRVAYLRGDRSNEGTLFRTRSTVLGDIIDSSPVLVGPPSRLASLMNATISSTDTSYTTFKSTWSARPTRLYVGANDGMLHAFDADGKEVFAYVPSAVIGNLYRLTDSDYTSATHQYYVDGSPVTADVYYDNAWHTVLVGTLRGGGRALFALDITDPSNIKLLWEKSYSDSDYSELGFTYSRPTISLLHNGNWAVILGNGYNGTNDKAVLYLMNVKDGSLIKALTVSDGKTTANGLATPRAADINGDLITDYVYAGDLHGNLWRFDLTSSGSLTSSTTASSFRVGFGGAPLYTATTTAGQAQPITSAPYLVKHSSGTGYLVIFGTGKYIESDDAAPNTTQIMGLYGIWDRQTAGEAAGSTPTLSRSKLQQQTITQSEVSTSFDNSGTAVTQTIRTVSDNAVTWYDSSGNVSTYGWYLDLPATGEMVVNNPYATSGVLLASTLTPNEDPCADGVTTWLMALNPYTGGATEFATLDLNNDGVVDDNDLYNGGVVSALQMSGLKGGFTVGSTSASSSNINACGSDGCVSVATSGSSSGRQNWLNIKEQE
ncbi:MULTISPECIES: pilus assembly protein [Pseudomonas]|uniref:pilus assembly protein n=1 Tax=Pseudomonas nitroreducens TaxID=46680 RepID=UPI001E2F47F5|nr:MULTISPECIES: PilC/PilY family type IV pilus protein [Pseudomonas]MCE4070956.1 pilus assembly protein PilY [Pseudomonas nitritireducens]MCE4081161.1 pilus assembly protein PilY [Pseudomonas nitroreducens]